MTLVGNPRPLSRTRQVGIDAAQAVATRIGLAGVGAVVDLSAPPAEREGALEIVTSASLLVVASPTFKGTYTGLIKSFFDGFPRGALSGTVALPVLVMHDARHALAVEVHFRPLLVELGATVPTPGLALLEADIPGGEALGRWADLVAPQVAAALAGPVRSAQSA
nr:NAD(P)H-dependent oxidoreductase [Actinomadura craniellae]